MTGTAVDSIISVRFQGEPGCYLEEALHTVFGEDVAFVSSQTFLDVLTALREGRATRAVLPDENFLAGTIHADFDHIFAEEGIKIVVEVEVDVRHCLHLRSAF